MTVKLTLVVCRKLPLLPVMVKVYVPTGVLEVVETVRVELPGGVSDPGLKEQVLRDGQPLRLRLTLLAKPFRAARLTV